MVGLMWLMLGLMWANDSKGGSGCLIPTVPFWYGIEQNKEDSQVTFVVFAVITALMAHLWLLAVCLFLLTVGLVSTGDVRDFMYLLTSSIGLLIVLSAAALSYALTSTHDLMVRMIGYAPEIGANGFIVMVFLGSIYVLVL